MTMNLFFKKVCLDLSRPTSSGYRGPICTTESDGIIYFKEATASPLHDQMF